ncbi:MAG: hypothetical protein LBR07_02520, partial [Puniceicoccales bacterium]|nr:hypothetical protein [Puniceicoccales bacterium]
LLRFQIGPVQDFIAAARSTRDLWSGSYLLSWLVAHGVKVARQTTAGATKVDVIYPAIEKQPLLDVLLKAPPPLPPAKRGQKSQTHRSQFCKRLRYRSHRW